MTEGNHKQDIYPLTKKWGFFIGICVIPIFFLFANYGDPGKGQAAAISAGVIGAITRIFWGLRNQLWFWATVAIIAIAHIPIVLLVPWPLVRWSYVQLLPIGFLDFALAYGVIRLVEKVIDGIRKGGATAT